MELSRFDFRIEFLEGRKNVIADSMSRLYESDDAVAGDADYVVEDDLDELFPDAHTLAGSAEFLLFTARFASDAAQLLPRLRRAVRTNDRDALELLVNLQGNRADEIATLAALSSFAPLSLDPPSSTVRVAPVLASPLPIETGLVDDEHDPLDLLTPLQPPAPPPSHIDVHRASFDLPIEFLDALPAAFQVDSQFAEILANPDVVKGFEVDASGRVHRVADDERRLCVPRGSILGEGKNGRKPATLREFVITAGHEVLAHAGTEITLSVRSRSLSRFLPIGEPVPFSPSTLPSLRLRFPLLTLLLSLQLFYPITFPFHPFLSCRLSLTFRGWTVELGGLGT
jgi:hypothetical protein